VIRSTDSSRRIAARSRKQLYLELLEPRQLLAGDTYLVNFQIDEATPVTRYLKDIGTVYGSRGGGLSYGWSTNHMDVSRERSANPDQRLDTLIHFKAGASWEFALPNGSYEVTASIGDPSIASVHTLNVEGTNYWNAEPLGANTFRTKTMTVTVADGRLTLNSGAAATMATRINFVHIVGVPTGPNASPTTPTITEPAVDGQVVSPSDVHMEAIGFADADGDTHKSTDWAIWTVGDNPQPVWQTLGIQGLERYHTHMGDGIFLNARAGQNSLAGDTAYELHVRFRDSAGAVSGYAVRSFMTGPTSATFPLELTDVATSPAPTWVDIFGVSVELPGTSGILSPGDAIIAIDGDGDSSSPGNEGVGNAIDGSLNKYLNFGKLNSGFIVTPATPGTIVQSFQITTANDAVDRDPTTWQLFGTNSTIVSAQNSAGTSEPWTLITSGNMALPSARNTLGPMVSFSNATPYNSYKLVFTGVKNSGAANSMQIGEVQFFGNEVAGTPPVLRLEAGQNGDLLLSVTGTDAAGNVLVNPAPLASHVKARLVITAGTKSVNLAQSNLTFHDAQGAPRTVYLPIINLAPGQRLDLWVAEDGSTYYGTPLQTEPEFSMLARPSESSLTNPYVAMQAGYVVELVGSEYRLPVNIAFVPNPGNEPDDPLYYVTELYGSIQVVRNDGTKVTFASGLLDYNPTGPISGTGEQGLTGIAVQRDAEDPEIYHLYVGMLWDNGAPPGNLTHYPKVERITSVAGGLSMASRTVLLNMQPETQGQSHQISNISIGPDGKLYVHNGDGFNASTAQNLDLFRGKVLRMNLDGSAPADNPFYDASNGITARDYVFAYGLRNPFGGAWRAADGTLYQVENGPSVDRFSQVKAGVNYGYDGSNASMQINAIYNWTPSHAPVNIAFVQMETFGGSRFPNSKLDRAFVSESGPTYATGPQANGKRIVEFALDAAGNRIGGPTTLIEYRGTGKSSIVGLAAGPDGLYFTELYEDTGANGATAVGARIFRVRYIGQTAGDYNRDDVVDGSDFLAWQRSFGSVADLNADGNNSRKIDAGDLDVWKNAYAAPAPVAPMIAAAVSVSPTFEALVAAESDQPLQSNSSSPSSAGSLRALTLNGLPRHDSASWRGERAILPGLRVEPTSIDASAPQRSLRQNTGAPRQQSDRAVVQRAWEDLPGACDIGERFGLATAAGCFAADDLSVDSLDAVFDQLR
jgi:glucose/arabinose dehydrogenase